MPRASRILLEHDVEADKLVALAKTSLGAFRKCVVISHYFFLTRLQLNSKLNEALSGRGRERRYFTPYNKGKPIR